MLDLDLDFDEQSLHFRNAWLRPSGGWLGDSTCGTLGVWDPIIAAVAFIVAWVSLRTAPPEIAGVLGLAFDLSIPLEYRGHNEYAVMHKDHLDDYWKTFTLATLVEAASYCFLDRDLFSLIVGCKTILTLVSWLSVTADGTSLWHGGQVISAKDMIGRNASGRNETVAHMVSLTEDELPACKLDPAANRKLFRLYPDPLAREAMIYELNNRFYQSAYLLDTLLLATGWSWQEKVDRFRVKEKVTEADLPECPHLPEANEELRKKFHTDPLVRMGVLKELNSARDWPLSEWLNEDNSRQIKARAVRKAAKAFAWREAVAARPAVLDEIENAMMEKARAQKDFCTAERDLNICKTVEELYEQRQKILDYNEKVKKWARGEQRAVPAVTRGIPNFLLDEFDKVLRRRDTSLEELDAARKALLESSASSEKDGKVYYTMSEEKVAEVAKEYSVKLDHKAYTLSNETGEEYFQASDRAFYDGRIRSQPDRVNEQIVKKLQNEVDETTNTKRTALEMATILSGLRVSFGMEDRNIEVIGGLDWDPDWAIATRRKLRDAHPAFADWHRLRSMMSDVYEEKDVKSAEKLVNKWISASKSAEKLKSIKEYYDVRYCDPPEEDEKRFRLTGPRQKPKKDKTQKKRG